MFQLMFAIITPALIIGAIAERVKFGALLLFVTGWFVFSYVPHSVPALPAPPGWRKSGKRGISS
jgi:ammonia channel protein AmtB